MHATIEESSLSGPLRGKHALTNIQGLCSLWGPCPGIILKTIGATQSVELSSAREAENRWHYN
jgi:hypothetical protein